MSAPSGLFDYNVRRIGDFDMKLKGEERDRAMKALMPGCTRIDTNLNHRDAWIGIIDVGSRCGFVITEEHGTWEVKGETFAWEGVQALDLIFGITNENTLWIDCLK